MNECEFLNWAIDIGASEDGVMAFCPLTEGDRPLWGMLLIGGLPEGATVIGAFGPSDMEFAAVERWIDEHREEIGKLPISDALRERLGREFDPEQESQPPVRYTRVH